jgi:hypothetical protein
MDQVARAEQQHAELINTLRQHNEAGNITVELVVLPLGVAGTMYNRVKRDLEDKLGVSGPALNKPPSFDWEQAPQKCMAAKLVRSACMPYGCKAGH